MGPLNLENTASQNALIEVLEDCLIKRGVFPATMLHSEVLSFLNNRDQEKQGLATLQSISLPRQTLRSQY
jgi:hypothetical protein